MTVYRLPPAREKRALNYRMAAKDDRGEIFLYDIIGASWFGGISAADFAKDLKALGKVKTIDLRINSDGGDVFDGKAMYSLLAEHSARIVVHVDGLAASIASLIAMAGDEIRMAHGSYMMVHSAWGVAIGDAVEMRRMAELLDSVTSSIADTYEARTKAARKDIDKWMADETWMTAEQAVDKGFADIVDEPVKAAASIREPGMFRNLPAMLRPRRVAAQAALDRIAATRAALTAA